MGKKREGRKTRTGYAAIRTEIEEIRVTDLNEDESKEMGEKESTKNSNGKE